MKKTLGILIIMVIIILSICVIKNRQVLCEKLPVRLLIVKSNSMYPTLQKGDFILIKRNNDYKKGDIITYDYESNYLVTHRIIVKTILKTLSLSLSPTSHQKFSLWHAKIPSIVFFS